MPVIILGKSCVFPASYKSHYILWNFAEQGLKIQVFWKLSLLCCNLFNTFLHCVLTGSKTFAIFVWKNKGILFALKSGT